jgi:hypothetical protein
MSEPDEGLLRQDDVNAALAAAGLSNQIPDETSSEPAAFASPAEGLGASPSAGATAAKCRITGSVEIWGIALDCCPNPGWARGTSAWSLHGSWETTISNCDCGRRTAFLSALLCSNAGIFSENRYGTGRFSPHRPQARITGRR